MNKKNHKTILITGGGTGIGLACATRLHENGYRVLCAGLDSGLPDKTGIEFIELDVSDIEKTKALLGNIKALDGLINAAGIILHDKLELTPDGFDKVVGINLNAVNSVTLTLLDALKAARGVVVNVASMWSYFGSEFNPGYAASKAGVTALTRSHAVAFAKYGIRVNAVAPGWIDTKIASKAIQDPNRSKRLLERIPMARWGQPSDVAKVIEFLLSENSDYITGAIIPVDGGFSIA